MPSIARHPKASRHRSAGTGGIHLRKPLHLVIERREISQDAGEKSQISEAKRLGLAPARLTYAHLGPNEEPLLWIADAVAWAYGAGGNWRQRTRELVEQVKEVDSCLP